MTYKPSLIQLIMSKLQGQLRWKQVLIAGGGVLFVLGCFYVWSFSQRYVSTEDAYINGNIVQIASRVTGQVAHLHIENNQFVEKGQLLFELDRVPFEMAVETAESQHEIDQVNLQHAQATSGRTKELVKNEVLSHQAGDDIRATLKSARATLRLSQTHLKEAKLKLSYTRVIAPTSGWITNMSLREGDVISENQSVFAVINNSRFWVDANFKETELTHIKKNQLASIKIDMYPDQKFIGIVNSISGGSGSAFSLMPPQNATGNWVKVTQRVPVRVEIVKTNSKYPLRIGTSAKVTIDLQSINRVQAHKTL